MNEQRFGRCLSFITWDLYMIIGENSKYSRQNYICFFNCNYRLATVQKLEKKSMNMLGKNQLSKVIYNKEYGTLIIICKLFLPCFPL